MRRAEARSRKSAERFTASVAPQQLPVESPFVTANTIDDLFEVELRQTRTISEAISFYEQSRITAGNLGYAGY